jgi:D-tyrosyl-tRNA(Tyr) deacylase
VKALLQRVRRASVSVGGEEIGSIGEGLVAFIGVADGDSDKDAQYLVKKIIGLRIFADAQSKFNLSLQDVGGGLLLVSQFTLLADTRKGRRPSFTDAAAPGRAEELFDYFVELSRASGLVVATGLFQQHMQVEIYNDGPVTIMLDSRDKFGNLSKGERT